MTITPEQCRAARALLDWSQSDLAKAAEIGLSTVMHFEGETRKPYPNTRKTVRATLEAAGVDFIPENGGGPGVRLRERRSK